MAISRAHTLLVRLAWIGAALLLCIPLALVISGVPLRAVFGRSAGGESFDSALWRTESERRAPMADDLVSRHLLEGKTRQEVHYLLGQPEESNSVDEYFAQDSESNKRAYFGLDKDTPIPVSYDVYYLGDERSLISIDSEWLIVGYDESLIVVSSSVRTD